MATKPRGVLANADIETDEEPGEAAERETPAMEADEEANPEMEAGEPGEAMEGGAQQDIDPRLVELSQLVVARVRQALEKTAPELQTALKADPVQAAVEFGTRSLRAVAMAAEQAGKALPFEAILVAGMQTIKDIGEIANELGYLPDEQIETFLKESFQQSIAAYARMDMDEGLIDDQSLQAIQQKLGGAAGGTANPGAAPGGVLAAAATEGV